MKNKLLLIFFCLGMASNLFADGLPAIFKVPFTIGAQFYDYQNYQQVPYLHGGMDLCAPEGSEVMVPVSGLVSVNTYRITAGKEPHQFIYQRRPFKQTDVSDTRYLEVAVVDANGNNWMFRHIDPKSVPAEIFTLAQNRTPVASGTVIGRVAGWILPVKPEPALYHHIHLEIVAADGSYLNPADFVATSKDYYPPALQGIYLVSFDKDQAFTNYPHPVVRGKISIIAGVSDRMNRAAYQHSVYSAQVELLQFVKESQTWKKIRNYLAFKFDRLPIIGDRTRLSNVIYRDSIVVGQQRIFANGNDGPRFFLLNLTAGDTRRGYDSYNGLDTRDMANGFYRVSVKVTDRAGNEKSAFQDFLIKN